MTNNGREFQARVAAIGNERSPVVECDVGGTTSAADDADRRRCRDLEVGHFVQFRRQIRQTEAMLTSVDVGRGGSVGIERATSDP